MSNYGIPYQGSKGLIADWLIEQLPAGERFCDLFGGGFAMSHCALLSGKYDRVLYNDIQPLLVELIKKALCGYYSYENFTPEWISREDFIARKEQDGYVKYIWSFGNTGNNYLFGKDIEEIKRLGHNYAVFGQSFLGLPVIGNTVTERRLNLKKLVREMKNERFDLQQLERLERLEQLELTCDTYLNYQHREGDVVYCDIPYEDTVGYADPFNHKQFYDWADSRDYAVYFSSYDIKDTRFEPIWEGYKQSTMASGGENKNQVMAHECLYRNKAKEHNPYRLF